MSGNEHLTGFEKIVWRAWNALDDDELSPVKTIARAMNVPPSTVAAIVYPAEHFGPWDESQEPDL